jgi:hypothetical protein
MVPVVSHECVLGLLGIHQAFSVGERLIEETAPLSGLAGTVYEAKG